jgi:hypothetical protein
VGFKQLEGLGREVVKLMTTSIYFNRKLDPLAFTPYICALLDTQQTDLDTNK